MPGLLVELEQQVVLRQLALVGLLVTLMGDCLQELVEVGLLRQQVVMVLVLLVKPSFSVPLRRCYLPLSIYGLTLCYHFCPKPFHMRLI